ncbi:MAG TPA: hypothetical protein VGH64_13395 [Puia sp.]
MRHKNKIIVMLFLACGLAITQCSKRNNGVKPELPALVVDGKQIFRYDDFGDDDFWTGLLHIDKAVAGANNGGFGTGVSPATALSVGLKVDAEALPPDLVSAIRAGKVDFNDPATTLALLKLNAVLGIKASFDSTSGSMKSLGITCAFCHSTVDNSFSAGIGKRLDGWPNRDLNVGGIISLTDNATPVANLLHVDEPTLRKVLGAWGPGKFAAVLFMDGKALRPDGSVAANLIPAAFGLEGIDLVTYTGWGDISYWNEFVGTLEMHGKGSIHDHRLNDPVKYPIAVENSFWNVQNSPDLITSKLPALRAYQHSIDAPSPPAGSFDPTAANRGKAIFMKKAKCATCHSAPLFADNILHTADEIGIDDFEAMRSPIGKYRTTPLGGLFTRSKGGYYHDGRFATLSDVIDHYNTHMNLNLNTNEIRDLTEYLKSF